MFRIKLQVNGDEVPVTGPVKVVFESQAGPRTIDLHITAQETGDLKVAVVENGAITGTTTLSPDLLLEEALVWHPELGKTDEEISATKLVSRLERSEADGHLVQLAGKKYWHQRVVCITVMPRYNQPLYVIDKGLEARIIEVCHALGTYCRVSKHQWFVKTDEPCALLENLLEDKTDNLLVYSMLLATDWEFTCRFGSQLDEWEFGGLGAFLQEGKHPPRPDITPSN